MRGEQKKIEGTQYDNNQLALKWSPGVLSISQQFLCAYSTQAPAQSTLRTVHWNIPQVIIMLMVMCLIFFILSLKSMYHVGRL